MHTDLQYTFKYTYIHPYVYSVLKTFLQTVTIPFINVNIIIAFWCWFPK